MTARRVLLYLLDSEALKPLDLATPPSTKSSIPLTSAQGRSGIPISPRSFCILETDPSPENVGHGREVLPSPLVYLGGSNRCRTGEGFAGEAP